MVNFSLEDPGSMQSLILIRHTSTPEAYPIIARTLEESGKSELAVPIVRDDGSSHTMTVRIENGKSRLDEDTKRIQFSADEIIRLINGLRAATGRGPIDMNDPDNSVYSCYR
jgi:hypothetical protein